MKFWSAVCVRVQNIFTENFQDKKQAYVGESGKLPHGLIAVHIDAHSNNRKFK